jgi:hypothetical protein
MTMRLSNDYWNEAKSQRGTTASRERDVGYWNEIDPKETKQIIQNERDCFHSRAQAALDEVGGRFAKVTSNKVVTGAAPVQYPAIPSGPWSQGDPGAPDPATNELGYPIDEVDPVVELPTSSADQSNGSPGDPNSRDAAAASSSHSPGAAVLARGSRVLLSASPHKSWRRY